MNQNQEKATFAAGCFWRVQRTFDDVNGVISTTVGYAGGEGIPTYETAEEKSFAEAIEIIFDPQKINYEQLLDVFWNDHDPTTLNRQRADIGKRYRSAIFYHDEKQKELAIKSRDEYQKKLAKPIVTQIVSAKEFFPAEEYHQKYFERRNKGIL